MNHRFAIVGVFGVLIAIGVPFFLVSQMELGSYAKSPQTVEIPLGSRRIVAGGKAKIWFAGGSTGSEFEISCSKDGRYVLPQPKEKYDACGIHVTLVDIDDKEADRPPKASFKIEWDSAKK